MNEIECRECGTSFAPQRVAACFCSSSCRNEFNNRRMQRGAEIYDLWMMMRYQRGVAQARGLWTIICRISQGWKEDDARERAGRQSWRDYDDVHDRVQKYRATRVG